MGSVHSYSTKEGKRYLVRFFKPDLTHGAKRGFRTKRAAEEFLASVSVSISQSVYVDPSDAKIPIGDLAANWLQDQAAVLKPSAMRPLDSSWRVHVQPRWGHIQVGAVRYSDVRTWVTQLASSRGATTVIRSHGILAAVLDIAVRDRRLTENPARGIKLPKKKPKRRVYLTHGQVDLLATEARYPEVVYFLSYTGLRWGEVSGLRAGDFDVHRRRAHVQENAVMVGGTVHTGTPKSHVKRSVPYPDFLDTVVRATLVGKSPDQLAFGEGNASMRLPNSQDGWFANAVKRARRTDATFPRVTIHDLRHTAASLAISAGANVKAVQRMLGHASAAMTLDTYADLFDDDLDYVASALSAARKRATIVVLEATSGDERATHVLTD